MRTLTYIILRRINNTLRISLPLEFGQKHDLKEGDHALWIEEEDGVKLKFAKLERRTIIRQGLTEHL
jgi:hypothetical protein